MKVVILCGGKGTRLGEVTGNLIPKPMATVGDEPILLHLMRSFSAQGFREFILCAGHLSWSIKSLFLNYREKFSDLTVSTRSGDSVFHADHAVDDWEVTIAETGPDTMTAGRIRRIAKYLTPGESFMLTYGDGLADVDLSALLRFHNEHDKLATMTGVVPPGRFGELEFQGDQVTDWAEKPVAVGRYINGGFMVLRPEFLNRFVLDKDDSVMLEREPLAQATRAGELMLYRHHGFWQCMDTMRDWELLNELWNSGRAPWARS